MGLPVRDRTGMAGPEIAALVGQWVARRVPGVRSISIEVLSAGNGRPIHARIVPGRIRPRALPPFVDTPVTLTLGLALDLPPRERPLRLSGSTRVYPRHDHVLTIGRALRPWSGFHLPPGARDPWIGAVGEALGRALEGWPGP